MTFIPVSAIKQKVSRQQSAAATNLHVDGRETADYTLNVLYSNNYGIIALLVCINQAFCVCVISIGMYFLATLSWYEKHKLIP